MKKHATMSKYSITRLSIISALGVTTAATGLLAGGVAGATPSHDYESGHDDKGKYSQHDSWRDNGNDGKNYNENEWGNWEPSQYKQDKGGDFDQWWNDVNYQVKDTENNWHSDDSDESWTPSGDNWQSEWGNWDPQMWQDNGSSYDNWREQITEYMTQTRYELRISYESSESYKIYSGDGYRYEDRSNRY